MNLWLKMLSLFVVWQVALTCHAQILCYFFVNASGMLSGGHGVSI